MADNRDERSEISDQYFKRPAGNGGRVHYPITRNSTGGDYAVDPDPETRMADGRPAGFIYSGMTKRQALQGDGFCPVRNSEEDD